MHVCAPHAYLVSVESKRALDPLELKILTSVHCLVSAGNCTLEEHQGPLITQLLPSSHSGYLFVYSRR